MQRRSHGTEIVFRQLLVALDDRCIQSRKNVQIAAIETKTTRKQINKQINKQTTVNNSEAKTTNKGDDCSTDIYTKLYRQ